MVIIIIKITHQQGEKNLTKTKYRRNEKKSSNTRNYRSAVVVVVNNNRILKQKNFISVFFYIQKIKEAICREKAIYLNFLIYLSMSLNNIIYSLGFNSIKMENHHILLYL